MMASSAQKVSGERWTIENPLPLIPDKPTRIYGIGNQEALAAGLAVVGARRATPYGLFCAHHFAQRAAQAGIVIISGGAIGCDQAAHRGALEAHGKTVVVLGGGADVIYPRNARSLFQDVVDAGGALISEQTWGFPPEGWTHRKRNRIIAGLSSAVLVVEAGLPSGTFSTADAALEQGKEVFAIPGSIMSKESRGSNQLIAQGAIPIVDDESFDMALSLVLDNLPMRTHTSERQELNEPDTRLDEILILRCRQAGLVGDEALLKSLIASPLTPDELLETGMYNSAIEAIRALSRLESAGFAMRYRDGRYGALLQ